MRKTILIFLFVLVCFFAFAQQTIVIYQLEIFQLSDELTSKLGLKELHIDKPDLSAFDFRITYDPSVMELLVKIPFITTTFDVGTRQEKEKTSSRPWVSTLLGKSAVLYVGSEELSLRTGTTTGTGIKVQLTPLNITDGKVSTKMVISDPYSPTVFDNELWVGQDFAPICLVTMKTQDSIRYFAIYARASFLSELPKENVFMIGSMDELSNLFEPAVNKTSEIYALVTTDFMDFGGEIGASIWVLDSLSFQSKLILVPFSFMVGVESSVGKEGLRAGIRFIYDEGFYLALGASDYSRLSDVLTLFAEFYPFKLLIDELKFVTPSWKVGAELDFEGFNITLGAYNNDDISFWCDGQIKVNQMFFILIGAEYSLNGKIYLRVGLSFEF